MTEIKRGFVDIAEGQAHYRTCGDANARVLVMFHGSPGSSFSLTPLMRHLGRGRRVIALDTLGNGDSSPHAKDTPEIRDLADAHMRAIGALGLKEYDLYGYHTGTSISTEISIARPEQVRRIVLEGVSVFSGGDQANLYANNHAPDIPLDLSGTHLIAAWTMVRDAHLFWPWWDRSAGARRTLGLPSPAYLTTEMIEVLKASRTYFKSYNAALRYPKRERLPLIKHPTLIAACPSDQLFGFLDVAQSLVPNSRKVVTPDPHKDEDVAEAARIMLAFLDER
jgi:pimeloyl-ACP methyl ester carboxylesterase